MEEKLTFPDTRRLAEAASRPISQAVKTNRTTEELSGFVPIFVPKMA